MIAVSPEKVAERLTAGNGLLVVQLPARRSIHLRVRQELDGGFWLPAVDEQVAEALALAMAKLLWRAQEAGSLGCLETEPVMGTLLRSELRDTQGRQLRLDCRGWEAWTAGGRSYTRMYRPTAAEVQEAVVTLFVECLDRALEKAEMGASNFWEGRPSGILSAIRTLETDTSEPMTPGGGNDRRPRVSWRRRLKASLAAMGLI